MDLEYNIEEKKLLSVFHQYRNDINIYTEDCEKDKAFYEILFQRLLENTGIQVSDVFPIGNCHVVEKASKEDPDPHGFYIIDGDIYVIFAPKLPYSNLFVLDSYCIENFVVDEKSVTIVTYQLNGGKEKIEDIKAKIDFGHAFDLILQPIMNLFFYMSIERKYRNIHELKEYDRFIKKGGLFNRKKVELEIEQIKNRIVPHVISSQILLEELQMLKAFFPYNINSFLRIVSGKDYIIPYLKRYISKKMDFTYQLPNESWKYQFVQYCEMGRLDTLKQAIIEKASAK